MQLRIHVTAGAVRQGSLSELVAKALEGLGCDAAQADIEDAVVYVEAVVPGGSKQLNEAIPQLKKDFAEEITAVHF